jgi:hypothetical protein
MGTRDRHQKRIDIKEGRVDDVGERTTLAGRTKQTLITGNCCHNSVQKNGMIGARVKFILTAKSVGGG